MQANFNTSIVFSNLVPLINFRPFGIPHVEYFDNHQQVFDVFIFKITNT